MRTNQVAKHPDIVRDNPKALWVHLLVLRFDSTSDIHFRVKVKLKRQNPLSKNSQHFVFNEGDTKRMLTFVSNTFVPFKNGLWSLSLFRNFMFSLLEGGWGILTND